MSVAACRSLGGLRIAPQSEEYGEARLAEFLRNHLDLFQDSLVQALITDVLNFCDAAKPGDDMTLMLVSRQV